MAGKVIAVANMKGGVGKTVTVVSIAEALAAEGHKVLVVDLDAQANASYSLAGDKTLAELIKEDQTISDYLLANIRRPGRKPLSQFVRKAVSNVTHANEQLKISIVASSVELRLIEREIIFRLTARGFSMSAIEGQSVKMLEGDLPELKEAFDFVIFDCAPGVSAFTEVAIRLSDLVVIPTIADRLSMWGLEAFCNSIWKFRRSSSSLPKPKGEPYVLVTRRQNTIVQNAAVQKLKTTSELKKRPFGLFVTEIPHTADIPKAMDLYPDNSIEPYPTYGRKWGSKVQSVMNELLPELKGEL